MQEVSPFLSGFANKKIQVGNYYGSSIIIADSEQMALVTYNRGDLFESPAPDDTVGLRWTSKLGFTGFKLIHKGAIMNGMNESGLSFELSKSEYSHYPTLETSEYNKALSIWKIGEWVLGNFTTVHELIHTIQTMKIWSEPESPYFNISLQISVHDEKGDHVEIKFIDGQLKISDNFGRILTLEQEKAPALAGNMQEHAKLMEIIKTLYSSIQKIDEIKEKFSSQCSQITDIPVIKDLKNRIIMFRPIGDPTLRAIFLKKMVFEKGTKHPNVSLRAEIPTIVDITSILSINSGSQPGVKASELILNQIAKIKPGNVTGFLSYNYTNINGWTQLEIENDGSTITGQRGEIQSLFTSYSKQISLVASRTINEIGVYIETVSWYGARQWNNSTWFSAQGSNNDAGILSMANTPQGESKYYPLSGLGGGLIIPLLIPSHSSGSKVCVFKSQLGLTGVSVWEINLDIPKEIFSQEGFEDVFFLGDAEVIVFREALKTLECWNVKTQQQEFILKDWWADGGVYMGIGPYNNAHQVMLASNGTIVFGFDLVKKQCAFTINFKTDPNGVNVYDTILIGDDYFYCREISDPTVRIYDIRTGTELHTFQIGGDIDNVTSDDYPICVIGTLIYALKSDDRKTVCVWDAKTGQVVKTFEAAPQDISGIFYSEGRLITSCQIGAGSSQDTQSLVIFWDINTDKQLKVIAGPKGYCIWVQDITDGKLMLFVTQNNSDKKTIKKPLKEMLGLKHEINKSIPLNDKHVHHKLPQHAEKDRSKNLKERGSGSNLSMPFMPLPNNSIHLEFYDCESCNHIGYIKEEFPAPKNVMEILANYSNDRLFVDSDSVIFQDFNI